MTSSDMIEVRSIEKRYVGVHALKGVSMTIKRGSIHGLVGENGAGKSTLGKILGGIVRPDGGDLLMEGRAVHYSSPREALADGVAVIQQELALLPKLNVAENVFLGVEPRSKGWIKSSEIEGMYEELEDRAKFGLDPERKVGDLSVADQQKVEILRALARQARVLIMDEPTSSLGVDEIEQLHRVMRSLQGEGMTIIYISHFLDQVLANTDYVTIFRNGELVKQLESSKTTVEELVEGMLGQPMSATFPKKTNVPADAEIALEVENLTRDGVFEEISLNVRSGEVLGIAGLVGSGRSEVARAIFGADKADRGTVRLFGEELKPGSPPAAISAGLAFAPEDRKQDGLLLELSQVINVSLPHLDAFSRIGIVDKGKERKRVAHLLDQLGVVPRAEKRSVINLSGGNQQKVMFAKWLIQTPRVLILDEPTRGVDIGAKSAIYDLISHLATSGMAVVVISSELEEILGLAHRVMVMKGGRIEREFGMEDMSSDAIMQACFGLRTSEMTGDTL